MQCIVGIQLGMFLHFLSKIGKYFQSVFRLGQPLVTKYYVNEKWRKGCELFMIAHDIDNIRVHVNKEGRKEMFYLTTQSTHFIYGYMASDIW